MPYLLKGDPARAEDRLRIDEPQPTGARIDVECAVGGDLAVVEDEPVPFDAGDPPQPHDIGDASGLLDLVLAQHRGAIHRCGR